MTYVSRYSDSSKQSSTYITDITNRQKKLDEKVDAAVKNGTLSDKQRAALVKMAKSTSALMTRYTADGKLDGTEYKKVLQASEAERAALEKLVGTGSNTSSKTRWTKNADKAVANQKNTLNAVQNGLASTDDLVKTVKSYGGLSTEQAKNLDTLTSKAHSLLTDAMKDGVMTRGEYGKITEAQGAVNKQIRLYQSSSASKSASASSSNSSVDVSV